MFSVACIGNILPRRPAFLFVAFALAIAASCGGASEDALHPACAGLETVADRAGLIVRGEAEERATNSLALSAPEVTGVEIERVVGICLTTFRSYEQDLMYGEARSNPDIYPPDAPVWIVEVKGISRPAGISAANADNPYRYAMDVSNARTGDTIAGSRYQEPKLTPAQ